VPEDPDSIRVSGSSKVAAVAGKIAHTVRANIQPSLSVVGKPSINQAVKAIAVARK
jgi:stage V sporulation protein SpoVS